MAAAFMLLLLLSAVTAAAAAAQQRNSNISLGSSLTPTTNPVWFSPSGIFAFGFYQLQPKGYAVCIFFASFSDRTVVWTANRDNPIVPNNVNLQLTNDGRLILQQKGSLQDIYSQNQIANHSEPAAWASMLDNGNFVLYNSDGRVTWQSFDHPTDTLLPGQRLSPGGTLFSSASETNFTRGKFMLAMQTDGNLVQYPVAIRDTPRDAYYATDTNGPGRNNVSLNLGNDGRLYLLINGTSVLLNLTGSRGYPLAGTIYRMTIDVDGIFRVYNRSNSLDGDEGNWTSIWSSTEDKCVPKGLCGKNSFCTYQDQTVDCECLPGFVFAQPSSRIDGCTRNFPVEGCTNNHISVNYEMRTIWNVVWEETSYDVVDTTTQEHCGRACLDDCGCEVAFFKDGQCRKEKLPLRYGRRLTRDSNTVLVKLTTPAPPTTHNSGSKEGLSDPQKYVIIGVTLGIAGLVVSSTIVYYVKRRLRDEGQKSNQNVDEFLVKHGSLAPKRYSYNEIRKMTKSFTDKLGEGGYGIVYKGNLPPDGEPVAVKVLTETHDNAEEFINEMASISRTSHVNIVSLLGFCYDLTKRALVYEFMPNKSLDKFIYKSGSTDPECSLEWEKLYKIAVGVARGLEYLHRGCNTRIVHFDIKPQNILLDDEFCPKISDFGLAKLFKKKQSTISMFGARGTIGYIAPEVFSRNFGIVSHKSDVYSYGMMILEMAEARKIADIGATQSTDDYFPEKIYEHALLKSKRLDDHITQEKEENVRKMLLIGLWCIQTAPSDRPSMTKVVEMLEGSLQSIQIPPKPFLSTPELSRPQFSSSFSVDIVETQDFSQG